MKRIIFYFSLLLFINIVYLCNGYQEVCTGHNNGAPCFINMKPDEKMFQKMLTLIDKYIALRIKKLYFGYKKDPSVLMSANSFILNHFSQSMIKTICFKFPTALVYKNPTIISLQYAKEQNSIRQPNGRHVPNNNLNLAQRVRKLQFLNKLRGRK